jgi:hypothetical protein
MVKNLEHSMKLIPKNLSYTLKCSNENLRIKSYYPFSEYSGDKAAFFKPTDRLMRRYLLQC